MRAFANGSQIPAKPKAPGLDGREVEGRWKNKKMEKDKHLMDARFVRWQGYAAGQLTVALALISSLSLAGLGAGLALLRSENFYAVGLWKCLFAKAMFLFAVALFFVFLTTISRTLDFRLTARKVRERIDPKGRSLTLFLLNDKQYGKLAWCSFWCACLSLLGASFLFGFVIMAALFGEINCCQNL